MALRVSGDDPTTTRVCPQCESARIRRSRVRKVLDHVRQTAGWHAFRCRECGARFHARVPGATEDGFWARRELLVYVIALLAGVFFLYLITMEFGGMS